LHQKKSGYQRLERRTYAVVLVKRGYDRKEHAELVFRITLRLLPLDKNKCLLHLHTTNVTVTCLPYLGSFFLDPEDIRLLGMGAIWNFVKGTGLLKPSTEYGAQKTCQLRPMCIGPERARTQYYSVLF